MGIKDILIVETDRSVKDIVKKVKELEKDLAKRKHKTSLEDSGVEIYYSKQDGKGKLFSKSKLWLMVRDYIKQCEKQGISKREMVEKTIEEFKYTPELKWNVSYKGYKG